MTADKERLAAVVQGEDGFLFGTTRPDLSVTFRTLGSAERTWRVLGVRLRDESTTLNADEARQLRAALTAFLEAGAPVTEQRKHVLSADCWCGPVVEEVPGRADDDARMWASEDVRGLVEADNADPPRYFLDAEGFMWREWADGSVSMARVNPDNSPIPEPRTYLVPEG